MKEDEKQKGVSRSLFVDRSTYHALLAAALLVCIVTAARVDSSRPLALTPGALGAASGAPGTAVSVEMDGWVVDVRCELLDQIIR